MTTIKLRRRSNRVVPDVGKREMERVIGNEGGSRGGNDSTLTA